MFAVDGAAMECETVFVVDGDEDSLSVLGELLETEGLKPRLFRHADDAAVALESTAEPPRLLLLDNMKPGTPGAALVQTLRGDVRWRRIATIVFTAWNEVTRPLSAPIPVIRKPEVYALLSAIAATRAGSSQRIGPVRASDRAEQLAHPGLTGAPVPGSSSR
jgi:CheY-like chemotaxis protein